MSAEWASLAWVVLCAALVMLMQGCFYLLKARCPPAGTSINVAIRNLLTAMERQRDRGDFSQPIPVEPAPCTTSGKWEFPTWSCSSRAG